MTARKALLVGASGLVGRHCLQLLLADEHYAEVFVLVRRDLGLQHPKLVQYIVDFSQLDHQFPDIHCHDIYCCLGTTIKTAGSQEAFRLVDFTYPLAVATQSLNHGAEQFLLVSALGASPQSSVFYNRIKGETERAIQTLGFESVHIFQPSLLLGERDEKRFGEGLMQTLFKALSFLFVGPLKKYKAIPGSDVALAMITVGKRHQLGNFSYESDKIQTIATPEKS